jgi:AcrR family transcriptional regulator
MQRRNPPTAANAADALLDAARVTFVAEGLEGLSLRRVAERAGCTTMAVYTRFGGKPGLIEALFNEGFDRLRDAQAAVVGTPDPAERVLALCRAYRDTAHAFPHHYALMLGGARGAFEPSAQSQQRSLATLTTLVDAVEAAVPAGAQRRARATALAHQLFAFCHGWVSLEQIGLLARQAASDRAFGAALHAIMATPNTAPTAAPIAAPIAAVKQQPQGRQGARRSR